MITVYKKYSNGNLIKESTNDGRVDICSSIQKGTNYKDTVFNYSYVEIPESEYLELDKKIQGES